MSMSIARLRNIALKLRDPRRIVSFLGSNLAYFLRLSYVPFTPPRMDIEPNNTCNLRCRHCQVPHWSKPPASLDEERFRRILDQLPGLLSIKLQGMGEPLLNRHLAELLQMGEKRGISMQIISNGTLLTDERAERLLALRKTHICFSMDGATAATFERIRTGADFAKVVGNIRKLVRARGGRPFPMISLSVVMTGENIDEIPLVVALANDLGVQGVNVQTAITGWGKTALETYNRTIRVNPDTPRATAALRAAREEAARHAVDLTIQTTDYYTKKRQCPWPWTRAFIAANGDVVPCCILADADTIKMGNVFEQSFSEIWNSPAYRDLRRRIKTHQLHDFCKNCYR
jgi:radical SAM protein with 4Fe4S-binding SPASM domain